MASVAAATARVDGREGGGGVGVGPVGRRDAGRGGALVDGVGDGEVGRVGDGKVVLGGGREEG